MNKEGESHTIPAIIAVVGIVAFGILVYLFISGLDWLINRIFGSGVGTPI